MSKQEEIVEGLQRILQDALMRDDLLASDIIELQLRYLHSQGVVIKANRDSVYCNINMDNVPLSGKTAYVDTAELAKAGYVAIKSLIEEKKSN